MIAEPEKNEPESRIQPPITSITLFAFIGGYALLGGIDRLTPDLILLLVAATCTTISNAMRDISREYNNALTTAIRGFALAIAGVASTVWLVIVVGRQSERWPGINALVESQTVHETLQNLGLLFSTMVGVLWLVILVASLGFALYFDLLGGKRKKSD